MKISRQQLKVLVESLILNEGRVEDLLAANPQLQPAIDAGIKNPNQLLWLLKMEKFEPIADMVGLIPAFEQNKQRLAVKDLDAYRNPNDLRAAIEAVGESKGDQRRQLKEGETDIVYEDEQWIVVMPHTMESSIQWGKGTKWCTAATQSANLFYSYVGRKDQDIVLYYIIKKGSDSKVDPDAKLSVGFVGGEPVFSGESGGLTVNSLNAGLSESSLKKILGSKFDLVMSAMKSHSKKIEGKHPAKKAMQKIAQSKDPSVLDRYTLGMKPDERSDFIKVLLEYDLSTEMLTFFANNEDKSVRSGVAQNNGTTTELLTFLSRDEEELVRQCVASNPNTPAKVLSLLSSDESSIRVRGSAAENPSTPIEILNLLARSKERILRSIVAENPSTPIETLVILARDKEDRVRQGVAENPNTPAMILDIFERNQEEWIRKSKAEDPDTPVDDLIRLASDESNSVKSCVAKNPNTPVEILDLLSNNKYMRSSLAQNPNTPVEILISIASDEEHWTRAIVAQNPSTPIDVLSRLARDKHKTVRIYVAKNPKVSIEDLILLARDEDVMVKENVGRNPTYQKYLESQNQLSERWIKLAGLTNRKLI